MMLGVAKNIVDMIIIMVHKSGKFGIWVSDFLGKILEKRGWSLDV